MTPTPAAATASLLDLWFPRDSAPTPAAAPELPADLDAAHDNVVTDYDAKRAIAEQRRARYVKRWWTQ